MVHPEEQRNSTLSQGREEDRREARGAGAGRPPWPGEVVGGHQAPPFEVVGVDALSPILMHVDFPATTEEIVQAIGSARIPVDKMRSRTVAEILDAVGPTEFRSSKEVEAAVNRAWDRIASSKGDNTHGRAPN